MSGQWHYILTMSWNPNPTTMHTWTAHGVVNVLPDTTRSEVYDHAVRSLRQARVIPDDAQLITNFLTLEPDLLAESSPPRAESAPRSGAAHPDPVSRDGGTGSGCASNP